MSNKVVELEIEDLAFDGKSVAHMDGKVVFLNGGLPGETVVAEITRSKPRYNQAIVREITKKCDARIPPICSHDDHCGGCTWQDLNYEDQLAFKKKQVVESIARIGGLEEVTVTDVIPSKEVFRYRNKMEFSFHTTPDGAFTLGLHRRGCFDDIFDLQACFLQSETANKIVHWVRNFVTEEKIPVYDVFKHTGFMRFLVIREAKQTGQLMVNVVTNFGEMPAVEKLVSGLMAGFPSITTIVHCENGKKSNIAVAEKEEILYGPGYIEEKLFDRVFRISANSFFQTNSLQTEVLYQTGFDLLKPEGDERLLDLYCGTGSIGLLLASRVREVIGVELVGDAILRARENAEINDIQNAQFFEANTKDFLKALDPDERNFDIVVIDPPRAGLHPKALKRTIGLAPRKLLYISCNPATFARDAGDLCAAGYSISEVKPVDMFPHTKHIELVAHFSR